ncbi:MAG: carbamoyltransferase HypF [Candidatus Brocadiaceae bacterium]|nr:carbamoyltransferase HypF [Candidatus Brocadiaceae bacterium]
MHNRIRIQITGTVQGVGFRPFVYNLANKYNLKGFCLNDSRGVLIEVQGELIDRFIEEIKTSPPPLSRIEELTSRVLVDGEAYEDFSIRESVSHQGNFTFVSSDIATCQDCLRELFDPLDRRHYYPFINCTNCGPRYSITKDIPYDRSNTTMDCFTMCEACESEYHDPANRRFHAQPNACPVCGPQLMLLNNEGFTVQTQDPISTVCTLLHDGKIVAVKGLGGYHLACDALNSNAVSFLRKRKYREDKPFAVMMENIETANNFCFVNAKEETLLLSIQRPIVLLRKKSSCTIPNDIAPDNPYLGVMLPYTPLHYLIIKESELPLVMTSGNVSDEPIAYKNTEAFARLKGIVDYFLVHDRDIFMRCDDSVVKVVEDNEMIIRRSRGYAPFPVRLQYAFTKPVLACGAFLKNTFCLARGNHAFLSHHIGDLENTETMNSYETAIEHYKRLFSIEPKVIAYDLHPEYISTKYALAQNDDILKIGVQHHHAHIVSCMAENNIHDKVIGVAFDGLGYGDDGKFWGGEFLIADFSEYERAGHLDYVPMPGGEQAIKEPWRMAISYLYHMYGNDIPMLRLFNNPKFIEEKNDKLGFLWQQLLSSPLERGAVGVLRKSYTPLNPLFLEGNHKRLKFLNIKLEILFKMLSRKINSPLTSSMGRLFDGVASLLDLQHSVNYEGQAAIKLESIADECETGHYLFGINTNAGAHSNMPIIIQWQPVIKHIIEDMQHGIASPIISARFHNTIVEMVVQVCTMLSNSKGINDVVLSGGVFQNNFLLSRLVKKLKLQGFTVYSHKKVPCNDGGLSLGQAVIASERYKTCV